MAKMLLMKAKYREPNKIMSEQVKQLDQKINMLSRKLETTPVRDITSTTEERKEMMKREGTYLAKQKN